jgi:hypothetical protein
MYAHHREALKAVTKKLGAEDDVMGVILTGSVAHGCALENSDVDIFIVYSDEEFSRRLAAEDVGYFDTECTDYEGGYIDGRAASAEFLRQVAARGSEPARYAFRGADVTFDRLGGLDELVRRAGEYPEEQRSANIEKFYAQFKTWRWYYYEALRRESRYLMEVSALNYTLFAGRLILAYNHMLYPGHKWLTRELDRAELKPLGFTSCLNGTLEQKRAENIERLYNLVRDFADWPETKRWSLRFILDSELGWLSGSPPMSDI